MTYLQFMNDHILNKNEVVLINEKSVIDGIVPAIISGVVKGYDENNVYIGGIKLNMEDINWVNVK